MTQEFSPLKFVPLGSSVDAEFWYELEKRKLLKYKLDDSSKPIQGIYSCVSNPNLPSKMKLESDAFEPIEIKNLYSCVMPGTLFNANTKEEFDKFDKYQLLKDSAKDILEAIDNGKWLKNPSILTSFLLLSFANLKDHVFYYWFGFTSIVPEEAIVSTISQSITKKFEKKVEKLKISYDKYKEKETVQSRGFFLILEKEDDLSVHSLTEWDNCIKSGKVYLGMTDPSNIENHPSNILKNYLIAAERTFKQKDYEVVCLRENTSKQDILSSFVFTARLGKLIGESIKCVGWEKNGEKNIPKKIDVGFMMDPIKLAESSVSLNLNLMKWRMFPELDLESIAKQKCLLIGSGTLGCQIARNLLAWGIFNITFIDRSKVSYSNPVRQPLYEFEDCLEGGKPKAQCAADHVKKIYPKANTQAFEIEIPMPGHIVSKESRKEVQKQVDLLTKLIQDHDVIFLLTDSRESRWLPTVLGTLYQKTVITVALGFESFVVMRHGIHSKDSKDVLGCYFCNDVVAPVNSTKDRSLDQQCTVTRPGTSAMSGGIAVELLVSMLQHPLGAKAPASKKDDQIGELFGLVPHQIRGSLSSFQNMILTGSSYNQCTACSPKIIQAFEKDGFDFLEKAFNDPAILEEITGLKDMKNNTEKVFESIEDEEFDVL